MSDYEMHEKFALEFAEFKAKFIAKDNDDDKLKLVHEFGRKYFNLALEFKQILSNISKWTEMKQKYRATDDIVEKLTIIENFIYTSFICENNECPIFKPIGALNLDLEFIEYTSLKKAKEKLDILTAEFKQWEKKYNKMLTQLNFIMKAVYQMYVVRNTTRFEKSKNQERLGQTLLFAKESKDTGMISVNTAGPFENEINQQYQDAFGKEPEKKSEKKNERLSKSEEMKKYREEGDFNDERIKRELGPNLEKIRNKPKDKKENEV